MINKTKIVATISPASSHRSILKSLISEGLNVARLNYSHGTHEEHQHNINTIRQISDEKKIPVA